MEFILGLLVGGFVVGMVNILGAKYVPKLKGKREVSAREKIKELEEKEIVDWDDQFNSLLGVKTQDDIRKLLSAKPEDHKMVKAWVGTSLGAEVVNYDCSCGYKNYSFTAAYVREDHRLHVERRRFTV